MLQGPPIIRGDRLTCIVEPVFGNIKQSELNKVSSHRLSIDSIHIDIYETQYMFDP